MALPGDLSTFELTFGDPQPYTTAVGAIDAVGMTGKLRPIHPTTFKPLRLVYEGTGGAILPTPVRVTVGDDGKASLSPVPHTDNATLIYIDRDGLTKTGFLYEFTWDASSSASTPGNKRFAVPAASGGIVKFDLLTTSEAVPGIVVPVVVSAQSLIGLDTDGRPFFDPAGIGTPTGVALDTDGRPYFLAP